MTYYLKHPNSDEMSEFELVDSAWPGSPLHIKVNHFIHWGRQKAEVETKVVEIKEARLTWKMLVSHGFCRHEKGA